MATKPRLASTTIAALENITAATVSAGEAWKICHERAMRNMDPIMLGKLAQIRDDLARIEREARITRNSCRLTPGEVNQ